MSYLNVKSIVIQKDGKVFITGAESNVRPLLYERYEVKGLSNLYKEKGRDAVYNEIGRCIFNGAFHIHKGGSKLTQRFYAARHMICRCDYGYDYTNYNTAEAGKVIAKIVKRMEENPNNEDFKDLIETFRHRYDIKENVVKDSIASGRNYQNSSQSEKIRKDRELAFELLEHCGTNASFELSKEFVDDYAYVRRAVLIQGCLYREASDRLKAKRGIILCAFDNFIANKTFPEHLPDLIPIEALFTGHKIENSDKNWEFDVDSEGNTIVWDVKFINKLISVCPTIHMHRARYLLEEPEIAKHYAETGKYAFFEYKNFPDNVLRENKDIQDVLLRRAAAYQNEKGEEGARYIVNRLTDYFDEIND